MPRGSEQYEAGMKVRREVMGDDHVDRSMNNADDWNRDLQDLACEYGWGASWARGRLARRERSIMNLGMLTALNRPDEFKNHFRAALRTGITVSDLREVCLHTAIYCGVPAAMSAFKWGREVLEKEGYDLSKIDDNE